ncbi:MAG: hypothetical protein AABW87_03720, partial [Nanoarchaeota archaeon]
LSGLVGDIYDPSKDDHKFDPEASRGSSEATIRFFVDERLKDYLKYLLLFLKGANPSHLDDRLEDICGKARGVFSIPIERSPRVYSHGDETAMNTKLYKFAKPNQPKEEVRSFVFDLGEVMVAPLHLGAAGYISTPTINLAYSHCAHLAYQYLLMASRMEKNLRDRTRHWRKEGFAIFKDEKEMKDDGYRDLFLFDIAMLYAAIRHAGAGARREMTSTDFQEFVAREKPYKSEFMEIPGENHRVTSNRANDNRGKHGDDGRVARALSRFDERLQKMIEGKTRYTLSDEDLKKVAEFRDIMKTHFGEGAFVYNKRPDSY